MIEIVPNWHPIWVHFAIALLITAAGSYLLLGWKSGRAAGTPPAALVFSRWLLWLGTAAALSALLTGYWASNSVAHDQLAHANMMVHRNWALAAAGLFVLVAALEIFRRGAPRASAFSALLLLAGGAALVKTGLEGAENVYEHGLGVQRLPETAAHQHNAGESHDHGDSHGEVAMEMTENEHGTKKAMDAAGEDHADAQAHSHDHGEERAPGHDQDDSSASDEAIEHPAGQVAVALHQALLDGVSAQIQRLMAPDVRIFESGNVESSLEEYAGHHMHSDMAFMGAMRSEVLDRRFIEAGGMATVLTRYRVTGQWEGQEIELDNTETLVLEKREGEWKIVHIHWSSG